MSFIGHVQNGVVVFDEPVTLPEGAAVEVREVSCTDSDTPPSVWDRLKGVVGKVDGLPSDASIRIDHYLKHGLPNQ